MGEAETIDSDDEARRLLRLAKLCRFSFLPSFLRSRGLEAAEELQTAARRGNHFALQVLAEQPDHLFSLVWRDLVDSSPGLRTYVHRDGGGYESGYSAYGRADRVSRDLAQLVLHPAADELTDDMRRIVAVAAALRDHPLADIARQKILAADDQQVDNDLCELAEFVPGLATFCRVQGLVPSDPAQRPLFFLLTGQYSRYRSTDPYGSVAVAAYTAADGDGRTRLSNAAIDGGLFELLRRMTEAEGEFADLLQGEQFTQLSAGLAQHERWSLLWELLIQVPVAVAVERSHLFPDDWRPGTTADQQLLAALRAAPTDLVTATAADPHLLALISFKRDAVLVGLGRSRAAVFTRLDKTRLSLDVYDLPGGELITHGEYGTVDDPSDAVSCDGAVVAGDQDGWWCYLPDDRIPLSANHVRDLTPTADGWAGLSATQVLIGSSNGQVKRRVQLTDLGLERPQLAVSADGTRLALAEEHTIVVLDLEGGVLEKTQCQQTEPIHAVGFLGDGVVTAHQQRTEHRAQDNVSWYLIRQPTTPITATLGHRDAPALDELPSSPARLRITTAHATLQLVDGDPPTEETPTWISTRAALLVPGTHLLAESTSRELRLYHLRREDDVRRSAVLELLNQPIRDLRQTDLELDLDDPCVEVLRACRDYR